MLEWAAWEVGRFVVLYLLLLRALSRRQVGLDGELYRPPQPMRGTLKAWLQRVIAKL